MRDPVRKGLTAVLVLAVLFLAAVPSPAAEEPDRGWERSDSGSWGKRPEVRAGYSDNGAALEMTLPPKTGVTCSRKGSWPSGGALLQMSADPVRPGGNEYHPGQARFPASVTFVYGQDALKVGAWNRVKVFFRSLRYGFRPSGIRLTYAWGTRLPVGSMYRLWEEETVFILAGPEESGKLVSAARRLEDDFRAAYGRPPGGPVTAVRIEARGPAGGEAPARVSITLRVPAD